MSFVETESVFVLDTNDNLLVAVVRSFGHGDLLFECTMVKPDTTTFDQEASLLAEIAGFVHLYYGYARALRSDWSPISESRIRKFLGTTSVKVAKPNADWLCKGGEVAHGAIRGVYPVNYWLPEVSARLDELLIKLPRSILSKSGVVRLTNEECEEITSANPSARAYLHFGGE